MKLRYNSGALEDSSCRVLAAVDGCTFRCDMNSEQQEAFGQQLAERWNAHDDLVAALTAAQEFLQTCHVVESAGRRYALGQVNAALAKAGAL